MAKTGRKSKFAELQIVDRYAQLAGPAFDFLKQMFSKGTKADKKWAVEQLGKGFSRMIPQKLVGDPDNPIQLSWLQSPSPIPQGNGPKPSITP